MIFDLTMPLTRNTPAYPGDPQIKIEPAGQFATAGYLDHLLQLGTHSGTHIDAPAHMIEGGACLNAFPPARFIGPGRLIHLCAGTPDLSNVQAGDIVLLSTGSKDAYRHEGYFDRVLISVLKLPGLLLSAG